MADDMGWGEPELYPSTSDHGRISTPNLNKFGQGGIQFTNAYAGYTVCAPSRTTLMTGFHSGHFKQNQLPGTQLPLSLPILTTQEMLQKAGYATAGVGKMAPLNAPGNQGFGHFIGQVDQGLCHNMYPRMIDQGNSTRNINLTANWADLNRTVTMADPSAFNYTVDITQEQALLWMKSHVAAKPAQPFFLYQAFTVPHAGGWGHAPTQPEQGAPVPSDGQYADKDGWPDVEKDHAAVITYLDNYVGAMMDTVSTLGIEENTIMFFASDNGAHLEGGHKYQFFNSTGGLLGHKRSLYEGGVRSPTMVRWPGTIKPGVSDFAWAFWDFMPTAAELSGGTAAPGIDGVSIVPTLMGKSQPDHKYLYWTWDGTGMMEATPLPEGWQFEQLASGLLGYRHIASGELTSVHPDAATNTDVAGRKGGKSGYGVRVGEWKGVVAHCANNSTGAPSPEDVMEVYHLPTDPFEANDLGKTAAGATQKAAFLAVLADAKVLCACYQC